MAPWQSLYVQGTLEWIKSLLWLQSYCNTIVPQLYTVQHHCADCHCWCPDHPLSHYGPSFMGDSEIARRTVWGACSWFHCCSFNDFLKYFFFKIFNVCASRDNSTQKKSGNNPSYMSPVHSLCKLVNLPQPWLLNSIHFEWCPYSYHY